MRKPESARAKPADRTAEGGSPCVAGIGASAGGFDAIRELLRALPPDTGIAFVVIQHLDPGRKSLAAELLAKCTAMPVIQANDGMDVEPNHVYTNPPDRYLAIRQGTLRLAEPGAPHGRRLPIDHFLRALGEDQREHAIGIILSGSGADGALGLRTIVENGGLVIAQPPETAQFDGMPRSAINTGLVSTVLPIAKMPEVLIGYARHPYAAGAPLLAGSPGSEDAALGRVMQALRSRCGFDFAGYKRGTLLRRNQRRMGMRGIKQATEYAGVLAAEPRESEALFKDLLIGVTEFFRDPEAWEALDAEVVQPLVDSRAPGEPIRVWVAGAATGEEAYSIAMLLAERLEAVGKKCPVQVFATDTNEDALAIARAGVYPAGIAAQMSARRLRRFFAEVADDHHYQVQKELRELVVFGAHNLLRDPPYSRMDLVSCRNLLIYLEPEIQKKIILALHFALLPGGHAFLGSAETVGPREDLFQPVSKTWRIFRRVGATLREPIELLRGGRGQRAAVAEFAPQPPASRTIDAAALVQRLIMDRFAPAAVLTNDRFEALYFCGPTDRFLVQPKGAPTRDLLALAREGLRSRLRNAIHEAEASESTVIISDAQVRRGRIFEPVKVTVTPLAQTHSQGRLLLAVFEDAPVVPPLALERGAAAARLVSQLEEELQATRDDLHMTIERLQSTVEELTASNEEVVSANEALQSSNEELESSKEELQSLNEELNTVNQQLQTKIGELETADSDLENLLASGEIATVCLDRDFRIKWFSPAAGGLFGLVNGDIGRPVSAFASMLSDAAVIEDARKAIAERAHTETEVSLDPKKWYLRRILPYRTAEDEINGVILTFTDITEFRRRTEEAIQARTVLSESLERQIEERVRLLRMELFKLAITEERERRAIATALHDELCQPLAAANLRLTALPQGGSSEAREQARRALVELIGAAERAARSLMYGISPPVLFDLGLTPALEWLAEEMHRVYGLAVGLTEEKNVERVRLDETVRSVVFRCVRELLVNVAKHAKVHAADVRIARGDDKLTVTVTDAGAGFDPALLAQPGSGGRFGLVSVRERIGFVDGTFAIDSIPGNGTIATLTVPLRRDDSARGGASR